MEKIPIHIYSVEFNVEAGVTTYSIQAVPATMLAFTDVHGRTKEAYTVTGNTVEEVLNNLPFKPVRARLMRLIPKRCYSTHYDFTGRYHLALVTSYHAHFVFVKDQKVVHIPADGCAYYVDTTKMHTALNGDTEDRIHLVIDWHGE